MKVKKVSNINLLDTCAVRFLESFLWEFAQNFAGENKIVHELEVSAF